MSYPSLSWNRIPRIRQSHIEPLATASFPSKAPQPFLAQGNGRSYGDVCLNAEGTLLLTRGLDKLAAFDPEYGVFRAQSGILLRDILTLVVPQGWFLGTVPGTSLATLGGAVANDVHGKNHHVAGCFGNHVRRFWLLRSSG